MSRSPRRSATPHVLPAILFSIALAALSPQVVDAEPGSASPDGVWRESQPGVTTPTGSSAGITSGTSYRVFDIDIPVLTSILRRVPSADLVARQDAVVLTLPTRDGAFERFQIWSSPVFSSELAAANPDISSFAAQGLDDPSLTATFVQTPSGFYAFIRTPDHMIYIEPNGLGNTRQSISYTRGDVGEVPTFECLVGGDDTGAPGGSSESVTPSVPEGGVTLVAPSGATLSTYDLAVTATGEFTTNFDPGGGTTNTMSQIAASVAAVNAIYMPEVAIRLVASCTVIFTDPANDPFTNSDDSGTSIGQNQAVADSACGSGNYDLGHVFHRRGGSGFSGLAGGNTCNNGNKAMAYSSVNNPVPTTMIWIVDQLSHEIGHQFGAGHTFNSDVTGCGGGNRSDPDAYEPGSGSTIMSYAAGTRCDYDFPQTNDGYFHGHSFDQITNYRDGGGNCGVNSATGNTPPTVNAGADFTIPQGTPFTLTATGADADGHALTYCWEQFDLGDPGDLATETDGPLFRSRPPVSSPARTFPILSDILAGNPTPTEILPLVDRTLNFRCTVRDNRASGGGVNNDAMVLTIEGSPFMVTAPNGGETLHAGCATTVTWTVGGGDVATNVNILLSTNGGTSFPTTLAANVPNDGSQQVELPCGTTSQGRIRIEPVGNIFFDVSNTNFAIVNDTPVVATTATGGDVGATCEFSAPYSATITDDCEVDPTTITVAAVSLDGLATVGTPTANVNVISATEVQVSGTVLVSALTGCPADVRITVSADDACGVSGSDFDDIEVTDTTPPQIDVALNRYSLWPANHRLATILATVVVSDNCPNTSWVLKSVTSDEPEDDKGDGDTSPDIVDASIGTADSEFQLRSERQGDGDGRDYTIVFEVSDACGNSAQSVQHVVVPHNMPATALSVGGVTPDPKDVDDGAVISDVAFVLLAGAQDDPEASGDVAEVRGPRPTVGTPFAPLDPRLIDPNRVQIGNVAGVADPTAWKLVDANDDGRVDAVFWFDPSDVESMKKSGAAEDGPIGLSFTTTDRTHYLIPDVFALGEISAISVDDRDGLRAGAGTLVAAPGVGSTVPSLPAVESHATTEFSGVFPNPFGTSAMIRYQLATDVDVQIGVFDLRGARVRTLASGRLGAGRHETLWDGHDDAGRRLPRGVYLIRFTAGRYTRTQKAVAMQ